MRLNALTTKWRSPRKDDSIWHGAGDDVIAVHGRDGRFLRVSDSASMVFGMNAEALVGKRLMDVVAAKDQSLLLAALARVSSAHMPGRARFDCQLRLGGDERAHAEIALARLPSGNLRSVTRPIEHRLCREQALKDESQRTLEIASRKSDYLANVSHEIRTPLNAVIGFADALHAERFGPIGNEKYRDYARVIHDSGAHLQKLIGDLLDLSKAEADELELHPEDVHPAEIIKFCVDVMQLQASEAGLYLRTEIDPQLGRAMLDVKVVRQILLNVVSNALKFTKEGGISISLRRDGAFLTIAVMDTGIGMSPDDLSIVGKRFQQAHKEGVRGARGTGIGLALSKALARTHRGELKLMSQVGEGTTALLRLPFEAAPETHSPEIEPGSNVTRLADIRRA